MRASEARRNCNAAHTLAAAHFHPSSASHDTTALLVVQLPARVHRRVQYRSARVSLVASSTHHTNRKSPLVHLGMAASSKRIAKVFDHGVPSIL